MSIAKKIALFVGDIFTLYIALLVTLIIRYGIVSFGERWGAHAGPFTWLFLIWLLVFYLADLYRPQVIRTRITLLKTLIVAVLVSTTLSTVALYLFSGLFELTPKTNLFIFTAVFFVLDYFLRYAFLRAFTSRAAGVAFLGESPFSTELSNYLAENPQTGYKVVLSASRVSDRTIDELKGMILSRDVEFIITQPPPAKDFDVLSAVYRLLPLEVNVMNFWDFYELVLEKVPLDELDEGWFLENIATRRPFYDTAKRLLDIIFSAFGIVILSPFLVISGLLVILTSRGPIIFKQKRIGKGGRTFTLYKFRIMVVNHNGSPWTVKNDPRLTPVGKILNFTHLNEFPQLVNVLIGDISFIGPRPESAELAREYQKLPYYEMRHLIKPGISGWAQINYKPSMSLEEAREKLCYDIYYIKNRSMFLDLMIILKTIKYVFTSHRE